MWIIRNSGLVCQSLLQYCSEGRTVQKIRCRRLISKGGKKKRKRKFSNCLLFPELRQRLASLATTTPQMPKFRPTAKAKAALFTVLDSLSKDLQSKICILAGDAHRRFDTENVAHQASFAEQNPHIFGRFPNCSHTLWSQRCFSCFVLHHFNGNH